ncbi:hypothetical protein TRV_07357 [Trichophyton verrucosum HKI 0517]|uniref:Uncharacterized protein n=1 Tax=Trichophyton verrucosum (strain HKI 0517) TaxID=663202 RepID=D4DJI9_TRIVH|nr:uncharacterized protein TRV_07357 [Trichophyton verrucosum HKI 0517]EFE38022.1 hypothetical protein TRV_07357 [Trichophyton verrucosum HKI 0517]
MKVAINCLTWLLAWKRKYTGQLDSSNSAINMACCKRITAAQVAIATPAIATATIATWCAANKRQQNQQQHGQQHDWALTG